MHTVRYNYEYYNDLGLPGVQLTLMSMLYFVASTEKIMLLLFNGLLYCSAGVFDNPFTPSLFIFSIISENIYWHPFSQLPLRELLEITWRIHLLGFPFLRPQAAQQKVDVFSFSDLILKQIPTHLIHTKRAYTSQILSNERRRTN